MNILEKGFMNFQNIDACVRQIDSSEKQIYDSTHYQRYYISFFLN